MPLKIFFSVFVAILAEPGDKTQLAILLFASDMGANKLAVFLGSSLALVLASLLAVGPGSQLYHWISPKFLKNHCRSRLASHRPGDSLGSAGVILLESGAPWGGRVSPGPGVLIRIRRLL